MVKTYWLNAQTSFSLVHVKGDVCDGVYNQNIRTYSEFQTMQDWQWNRGLVCKETVMLGRWGVETESLVYQQSG